MNVLPRLRNLLLATIYFVAIFAAATPSASAAPSTVTPFGTTAYPASSDGVVLSSAATLLGVGPYGNLGVANGPQSLGPCDLSSATGSPNGKCTTTVGLRVAALNSEGIADGCMCEGWGVAFKVGAPNAPWTEGDVNKGSGATDGVTNMELVAFTWGPPGQATWARSVVDVGGLVRVTHDFRIDPMVVNLNDQTPVFKVNVTIQNISPLPIYHLLYRRVVDFDAEPTPANEVVGYMLCNDILEPNTTPPATAPPCTENAQMPTACGHPPSEVAWMSSDPSYPTDPTVAPQLGAGWGQAPAPYLALPGPNQAPCWTTPAGPWETKRIYNAVAGPGDLGLVFDLNFTKRPNHGNPAEFKKDGAGKPFPMKSGETERFTMWFGAEKVAHAQNPGNADPIATTLAPCSGTAAGDLPETKDTSCGTIAEQDKLTKQIWDQAVAQVPVQVQVPFAPPPVFGIAANAANCVMAAMVPQSILGPAPTSGFTTTVPYVVGVQLPATYNTNVPYPGAITPPTFLPLPFVTIPPPPGALLPTSATGPTNPQVVPVCQGAAQATVTPGNPNTVKVAWDLIPGSVLPVLAPGGAIESQGSATLAALPLTPTVTTSLSAVICPPATTTTVMTAATLTTGAPPCPAGAPLAICAPDAVVKTGPGPYSGGIPMPVATPVPIPPGTYVTGPDKGKFGYDFTKCAATMPGGVCTPTVVYASPLTPKLGLPAPAGTVTAAVNGVTGTVDTYTGLAGTLVTGIVIPLSGLPLCITLFPVCGPNLVPAVPVPIVGATPAVPCATAFVLLATVGTLVGVPGLLCFADPILFAVCILLDGECQTGLTTMTGPAIGPNIPCLGPDPYNFNCFTVDYPVAWTSFVTGVPIPAPCPAGLSPGFSPCKLPLPTDTASETRAELNPENCQPPVTGNSPAGQPAREACQMTQAQICVIAHSSYIEGQDNSGPGGTYVGSGSPETGAGYSGCGTTYPAGGPCPRNDVAQADAYYYWGFHNDTSECVLPPPVKCELIEACGVMINPKTPEPGDAPCGPCVRNVDRECTPPTARFATDHKLCGEQGLVHFHDDSFSSIGNRIDRYYWTFGDGATSDDQNPTHVYAEGEYTVTLTVWDQFGMFSTFVKHISVKIDCAPGGGDPTIGGGAGCGGCPPPDRVDDKTGGLDGDGDGVPDALDNCPYVANPGQADLFHSGYGDVCNPDLDQDGIPNAQDNCPRTPNNDQADLDGDLKGDVCDTDCDGDGVLNALVPPCSTGPNLDNCPTVKNPDQADANQDGVGDLCLDALAYGANLGGRVGTSGNGQDLARGTATIQAPGKECVGPVCMTVLGWSGVTVGSLVAGLVVVLSFFRRK